MEKNASIKLRDIARESNASADQIKYWIKLLRIKPKVRGRTGYLTQPEAALLKEMIQRVGEGESPKEAAEKLTDSIPVQSSTATGESPSLVAVQESLTNMKDALWVMATELRRTHEKMAAMSREVLELRSENGVLRSQMLQILPPKPPEKVIVPWSPNPRKDPLETLSWWEKTWVRLVHPERCRHMEENTI